jgi:hypothetical protein
LTTVDSPKTPLALAATSGNGAITYAVNSAGSTGCTVNSSTAVLTYTAAGSCTVRATAAATSTYLVGYIDVTFTFSGLAAKLEVTRASVGTASGAAFTTQPQVTVQDSEGNAVTSSTATVTATISAGGALVGSVTRAAVSGIATFSNLGIKGIAGSSYTITYTVSGLNEATASVTATFGAATKLAITQAFVGAASGAAFTTQPQVTVQDSAGNTVTSSTATVTATISGLGALVGTKTAIAASGVATFIDIGVSAPATSGKDMTFTVTGLATIAQNFAVTVGVATMVALTQSPQILSGGSTFTTQPKITIRDSGGNTVTSSTATVTATISDGGTLVGTTSATAVSGIATFLDLGIGGLTDTTYKVTFTVLGLTSFDTRCTITYCVGSTGPSGGIVFYIAETFFTSTGSLCDTTCTYLEAAPENWGNGITVAEGEFTGSLIADPRLKWCSDTANSRNSYQQLIGKGRANTATGTAVGWQPCTSGAIFQAGNYRGGGHADWFLPSQYEFYQLCRAVWNLTVSNANSCSAVSGTIRSDFDGGAYWTSSETQNKNAWYVTLNTGTGSSPPKTNVFSVRPVRAFK